MGKEDVHLAIVLDQSSSMGSVVEPTIEAFNRLMTDQAALPGEAYLTLNLFSTWIDRRFGAKRMSLVPKMGTTGENTYRPNGSTALYDAVGETIHQVERWLDDQPLFDGRVAIVILTDGEENASKEWKIDVLNALIAKKRDAGWDFIFLGSGKASWTEAKRFTAIPQLTNVANFAGDAGSTAQVYAGVSSTLTRSRSTGRSMADFFVDETANVRIDDVKVDQDAVDTTAS